MAENIFIYGLIVKNPHPKAPNFIVCDSVVKVDEFYEFAKRNSKQGWLNFQIKKSREGKLYAVLNTYETPADKVYEKTKTYIEQEVLQTEPLPEDTRTSKGYNGEEINPADIPF